jgi:metal transporter CNNM
VKFLMLLFYPVAKPVALVLDKLLGQELRTVYGKEELVKMLEIHVRQGALDEEVRQGHRGRVESACSGVDGCSRMGWLVGGWLLW